MPKTEQFRAVVPEEKAKNRVRFFSKEETDEHKRRVAEDHVARRAEEEATQVRELTHTRGKLQKVSPHWETPVSASKPGWAKKAKDGVLIDIREPIRKQGALGRVGSKIKSWFGGQERVESSASVKGTAMVEERMSPVDEVRAGLGLVNRLESLAGQEISVTEVREIQTKLAGLNLKVYNFEQAKALMEGLNGLDLSSQPSKLIPTILTFKKAVQKRINTANSELIDANPDQSAITLEDIDRVSKKFIKGKAQSAKTELIDVRNFKRRKK